MNHRVYKILQLLLAQSSPLTVDQIAKQVEASNKTVRNDLKEAVVLCEPYQVSISKKTGVGVELSGLHSNKLNLKRVIEQKVSGQMEYSLATRRIFISLRLLNADEPIFASSLAKELYISKATVHKDIRSLRSAFEAYKLEICSSGNGMYVKGKERHIRDAIFSFMYRDNAYYKLSAILLNAEQTVLDNEFIYPSMDYCGIDFKTIFQIALDRGKKVFDGLSYQRTQALLLRIFINVIRVTSEHSIALSRKFLSQIKGLKYDAEAKNIYNGIFEKYDVMFNELEVQYLRAYINSTMTSSVQEKETFLEMKAREFTYSLIAAWGKKLKYPFDQDKKLFENVLAHSLPAMLRFQHAIPIENPLLETIKAQFKNTFHVTAECCKELSKRFNIKISEDEVGFLSLHLALALDRNKRPLKTLLISDNGLGVNELLLRRINLLVPYIEIEKYIDILEIKDIDIKEYDLLLSTNDRIFFDMVPTIFIGSLLQESDFMRLNQIGYKYYNIINDPIIKMQEEIGSKL